MKITVVSYNIQSSRGLDKVLNYPRTAEAIAGLKADLYGLQEVRHPAGTVPLPLVMYAEKTGLLPYFCEALTRADFLYGTGVLSRYTALESRILSLPSEKGGEPRAALFLTLKTPAGPLRFINTHFSYQTELPDERLLQMQTIAAEMSKEDLPTILTGDLNAKPDEPCIAELKKHFRIAGKDEFTFRADQPWEKIDYIAYTPGAFREESYEVVEEREASDHRPLRAILAWKE